MSTTESTIQIPARGTQRELSPWAPWTPRDGWKAWILERQGPLGLAGLLCVALVIALSASRTEQLLPQTIQLVMPSWLVGPFGYHGFDLGVGGLIVAVLLGFLCYLIVVRASELMSAKTILIGIAAFHAIVLLAPPLLSNDVFSYVAYGRLPHYHFNPYTASPSAIRLDRVYPYIDSRWIYTPSDYGPLFTALSYLLAPLSIAANVTGYKLIAALSSLAVVWIVWKAAALRGVNQTKAVALVGLNPVMVVFGVGGGHNDMLMLAILLGGVYVLLLQKERTSGVLMIAATAIKLTGGLLLPFALLRPRPERLEAGAVGSAGLAGPAPLKVPGPAWLASLVARLEERLGIRAVRLLSGALIGVLGAIVFSFALFGTGPLHLVGTISTVQSQGGVHSISGALLTVLGLTGISGVVNIVLDLVFVVCLVRLLKGVREGRIDWITGAGWATVILLLTAGLLLPWYIGWLVPLAALSHDRRLLTVTFGLTLLCLTTI